MADVIQLFRSKPIAFPTVPPRLLPLDKWPRKSGEMKLASPRWRLAVAGDPLAGLHESKLLRRAPRGGKLRLFRVFKLLGAHKAATATPRDYREVGERLRAQRWLRRL